MSDWQAGAIMIATPDGRQALPGWLNPPFGLDWGVDHETGAAVWVVHHLPTGYNLMAVNHGIDEVLQLVILLRSLGDWSWSDIERVHEFADTLAVVCASGFDVFSPTGRVGRPTMPNHVPEVTA